MRRIGAPVVFAVVASVLTARHGMAQTAEAAPPSVEATRRTSGRCRRSRAPSSDGRRRKGGPCASVRDVGGDYVHFFSLENAAWLGTGGVAALAVHPADDDLSDWAQKENLTLTGGEIYGSQLLHIPVAIAVWAIGAAAGSGQFADAGRDLLRAQLSVGQLDVRHQVRDQSHAAQRRPAIVSVRPRVDIVRDGDGAAGALRLDAGCPGVRGRGLHRRLTRSGQRALGERRGLRRRRGPGVRAHRHDPFARHTLFRGADGGSWRRRCARHRGEVAMKRSVVALALLGVARARAPPRRRLRQRRIPARGRPPSNRPRPLRPGN